MNAAIDLTALKNRQQTAWASGDYAVIGTTLQIVGELLAEACDLPALWGTEAHRHELFGNHARFRITPRLFNFRYRSAAHFTEVFRTWYGPVHKAFAALPVDKATALERDLTDLLDSLNRGGADSLIVPSEYAEIVITP